MEARKARERERERETEREEWAEKMRVHAPCFHGIGQPNAPTPSGLLLVSGASNLVGLLVLAQISVSGFFIQVSEFNSASCQTLLTY